MYHIFLSEKAATFILNSTNRFFSSVQAQCAYRDVENNLLRIIYTSIKLSRNCTVWYSEGPYSPTRQAHRIFLNISGLIYQEDKLSGITNIH
jgi:hypothetical protein